MYNKATEDLKDSDKFTFTQEKASNLVAKMKSHSEKFKWRQHINSIQVFPTDLAEAIDPDNVQSLLLQPNLILIDSVRMHAAASGEIII